jgi:fibrillarin-like pre-rRNA processing protein
MPKVTPHETIGDVFWVEFEDKTKKLATRSLAPDSKAYQDERSFREGSCEYRIWDPYRSKLAAAIVKGIKNVPIRRGSKVLYLGAASGTTASFVSDIVGMEGRLYCVEISSRQLRDLLPVCDRRLNMAPILADAKQPHSYCALVSEVNVVYQDVAQPDQTDILLANVRTFLHEGGHAIIALKARSIDVTKEPREVFRDEMERIEKELDLVEAKLLDPYEKDHALLVLRK